MSKREYLNALLNLMSIDELFLSASNPTKYMSKTHVKLHYVALRKLGAIKKS